MTTLSKLRIILGAGDADDVLSKRIDVVDAAGKVYDAHKALMNLKAKDGWPAHMEALDASVGHLVVIYGRYKSALKRRREK